MNLFSFDSDASESLERESFTFEIEEPIERKPSQTTNTFSDETAMEFSFFVNEPIEEPIVETPQPKAEIKPEPVQKIEPKVQEKVAQTIEEPIQFEVENDFTFITKKTSNDKVQERRNKLKEFNSRYQNLDQESDFETVPAFRRKNISIGQENASEQKINTFLSENDGRMQVRENRFLNKDVD